MISPKAGSLQDSPVALWGRAIYAERRTGEPMSAFTAAPPAPSGEPSAPSGPTPRAVNRSTSPSMSLPPVAGKPVILEGRREAAMSRKTTEGEWAHLSSDGAAQTSAGAPELGVFPQLCPRPGAAAGCRVCVSEASGEDSIGPRVQGTCRRFVLPLVHSVHPTPP